jgi:DnaJ-domain-containing protein 1
MGRRIAFSEVLDEKLSGAASEPPATPKPPVWHVPTVAAFFSEFGTTGRPVLDPRGRHLYSAGSQPATRVHPGQPTPARRSLSSREQAALDQLVALGASVRADFTVDQLRSAFRSLARMYHPDRHPASTPVEKARLSIQFVQLHDAYRELQGTQSAAA